MTQPHNDSCSGSISGSGNLPLSKMECSGTEKAAIVVQQKKITALIEKAEKEGTLESLQEALHLCLQLIPEINQADDPTFWAEHRAGTANVAELLGRRTQQVRYLTLAHTEYESALTVFTQEDFPKRWSVLRHSISYLLLQKTMISQKIEDAEASVNFARNTLESKPSPASEDYLALSSALSIRYTLSESIQDAKEAAEVLDNVNDNSEEYSMLLLKSAMWLQAAKALQNLDAAKKSLMYASDAQAAMSKKEGALPLMAQPAVDMAQALIEKLKTNKA